jgi:hypothetical protein
MNNPDRSQILAEQKKGGDYSPPLNYSFIERCNALLARCFALANLVALVA